MSKKRLLVFVLDLAAGALVVVAGVGCGSGGQGSLYDDCPAHPPAIVLGTQAGQQVGAEGTYCATKPSSNCDLCVDRDDVPPQQLTVVHPGDQATFNLARGTWSCIAGCPPVIRIRRAGCGPALDESRAIDATQPWTVDLSPGTYTLWFSSSFETDDGHGEVTDGFGLVVDPTGERGVLAASPVPAGQCPVVADGGA